MNELAVRSSELPSMPMEDVKQYVDVIGDAINALKAKRNAAGHLNADKAVIDEMDSQIREYSAMKLKAEMELGKKTAAMPKAMNQHDELAEGDRKRKGDALAEIGIDRKTASNMERLAKHEEVVNRYIEHQLEIGETPTRSGAFKKIADLVPKPKSTKQIAMEKIDSIKSAPIVSIQDAVVIKEEQKVVDSETSADVQRKMLNASSAIYWLTDTGFDDFKTFVRTATNDDAEQMVGLINRTVGYLLKLRNVMEGKQ